MLNFPGCLAGSGADMSVLTSLHQFQPNFTAMPHFQLHNNFSNELGSASASPATSSLDMDRSTTCAPVMKEEITQCTNGGGNTFKKRRPESDVVEESRDKRRNRGVAEEDHNSPNENSKIQDYVHVRARRGHATDSHSLAERARREKINKKMKSLQELVPGCNKPTGKAGMLDEIINYVQSLQRQVEFLSMKLAHVNPRLELSIDNIFTKEFPACVATTLSEMANLAYNQPNSLQPAATNCEMDTLMLLNPLQTGETRISSSPVPQIQSFSPWETDVHNIYNINGFLSHI